jgi:DNA-binding transcriptional LysR family regulator
MNDRIRELDFFLRVTEASSFSAAARSLDVDPSTISKVIQRLETRLSVRLFQRTSRILKLTQEGERFLAGAQRVVAALEAAEQSLELANAEATGVLRVNSTAAFARYHLAPLMPEFIERHPLLRMEFVLSPTALDIFEHQIDVSIQGGNIPDSTLVAKRVVATRWIMCASPAYLQKAGVPRSLEDLQSHRCLNFMPGSFRSRWPVKNGAQTQNLELPAHLAANSGDMLCVLACLGMGIARLADFHIGAELASGRLVSVLSEFQLDAAEPLFAVYASKRHLSPRVRVFLDLLESKLDRGRDGI